MACACKVENFTTAVQAREVRPDVVVPHIKVSQTVDLLGLVCQTVFVIFIIFGEGQSSLEILHKDNWRGTVK